MKLMNMGETWASLGSAMAGLMFTWAMFRNYFPYALRGPLKKYGKNLESLFYPYIEIRFPEYQGDGFQRSKGYVAIERYLEKISSKEAKRLKASIFRDCELIVLSMEDHEEVMDEYEGIKLWWASTQYVSTNQSISLYPTEDGKRYFSLTFHEKYREIITNKYLKHVLEEGKAIIARERQRKLYTNCKGESYNRSMWRQVVFEHPATFDTLGMDPKKKQEVIDDLITFSKSKEYYSKIGKPWKRGYLLYGPPGTGKSTMIAAMANLLNYDVYDLELTSVKDNTELRKLLIDTSGKSIIVIEDIDCSLDLTGQREKKDKEPKDEKAAIEEQLKGNAELITGQREYKDSKVTLSGLLNFIDGLWSAIGGERVIVFTTNYVGKLDPALIRRGRMDKHIELSYCKFEAFKVLAKNYLDTDSHELFAKIETLLEETNMAPADVVENLMPKCSEDDEDVCLERLIKALEDAKEEARLKAEEEERAEKEKEKNAKKSGEVGKRKPKQIRGERKCKGDETYGNEAKENGHITEEGHAFRSS